MPEQQTTMVMCEPCLIKELSEALK